jgi:hypothetical protein
MRRTTGVIIASVVLVLAACSGDADPSPPSSPTPTTPATAVPTSSPTPTAPVMPQAAKTHTQAGAKAFVEYFWEVVDYAQATGDTAAIRALSVGGCTGCDGGIHGIDKVYDAGGSIQGGRTAVDHQRVEMLITGGREIAHVTVDLQFSPQTIDMPGTTDDQVADASRARDRLDLLATDGGWQVAQLSVLP